MNPDQLPTPTSPPSQSGGWTPLPPTQTPAPAAPSSFDTQSTPSSTTPLGENYLDQISATEPVHVHKFAIIGLIGGILVLLIVVFTIMMNSGGPSLSTQAKGINTRIATLKTVADAQQKHLGDNDIVATNAILTSVLTTMSTNLTETMKAKKISLTKTSGSPSTEKTYLETLTKKMEDSYQRGTLDRTYAPQMSYELSILRSKLVALKSNSSSTTIDTFATESVAELDTLITSFNAFSATD
jgi:hypothetical protein